MNAPKKQHYVPQTYLRNFSVLHKNTDRIYSLHKSRRKIITTNIEDTAAEKHFYTVKLNKDQYEWENFYARKVEPLLQKVISDIRTKCENALVQSEAKVLTEDMKSEIAFSMVLQLLRGKHSRNFEKRKYFETAYDFKEKFEQMGITYSEKVTKILFDDEELFKKIAMEITFNDKLINNIMEVLSERHFVIYRIIGTKEFITSDNPVMYIDADSLDTTPFRHGLLQRTTVVYFPLSSKLLLVAYHPEFYFGGLKNFDGCVIFIESEKENLFIDTQNRKQYEQCYNQVYSRRKESLEELI